MFHPILDKHDAIAWDMDGTLSDEVHRAPNAKFFLAYIAAHPEKRHHIITFRNRSWADQIWGSLSALGINVSLVRSVESCPEIVHDCFQISQKYGNRPDYYMSASELTHDEFAKHVARFTKWKAERAKQIGCTILVDDIADWVVDGCEHHGVEFLHAHDPIPTVGVCA